MALRPNLVNKQFNSPINLYSQRNLNEALNKQAHQLYNGAVGIDFHNLAKPTNLANSAVLRMLEEEERSGRQQGAKRVAWPPPPEETQNGVIQPEEPIHSLGSGGLGQGQPQDHVQVNKPRWGSGQKAEEVQPPQVQSPQPAYIEPPKTVTLLSQAPIRQKPPPLITSQPATARMKGGARSRGDQKWPPESVKQQAEVENAERIALAKGPACRPRRVRKDYSQFFAQHALNPTYPGYKVPPGTQHYIEEGTSNL